MDWLTEEHATGLLDNAESLSADGLWVSLKENMVGTKTLHILACWVASICLHRERLRGRDPDARIWNALETKWRWIHGHATDKERSSAKQKTKILINSIYARCIEQAVSREAAWAVWEVTSKTSESQIRALWMAAKVVESSEQTNILREILKEEK